MTVYEIGRAHKLKRAQIEQIAAAVGVDVGRWEFGALTRSDAEKVVAELYRRKGLTLSARDAKALKTGAPALGDG